MTLENHSCRAWRAQIHDHLDQELSEAQASKLAQHLDACAACRREQEELLELQHRARALATPTRPARDLWPGIEARLEETSITSATRPSALLHTASRHETPDARATATPGSTGPIRRGGRRGWGHGWKLAAVLAISLLTALVALYIGSMDPTSSPTEQPTPRAHVLPASSGTGQDPSFQRVQQDFEAARQQLRSALEQRRDHMSPETLSVVDRNLELIDQAIGEIRDALERDPDNAELRHLLTANYQREVQVLRRMTRLPKG